MKKERKSILIVSIVIQMIMYLYAIINANNIVKNMVDEINITVSTLPSEMSGYFDIILKMFTVKYVFGISLLGLIILTIILLEVLFRKSLYSRKTLLIILSVLTFIFTIYESSYLFIIIDIIIFSMMKPIDGEKIEKKEIPKIERKKSSLKNIILAILMILIYAFMMSGGLGLFEKISANYINIVSILIYVVLIGVALLFFYKEIFSDFKLFKNNIGAYMAFIFNKLKYGYPIYFAVAFIALMLNGNMSLNQEELMEMPKYLTIPLAMLYAPLVEETVFRLSIRKIVKNDSLFIIISGVSFGIVHTLGESTIYNVIVASLPYVTLGGILAYLYTKSNNVTTNMFVHFMQNTIASLIMIFI